jgi:hypothetical protein
MIFYEHCSILSRWMPSKHPHMWGFFNICDEVVHVRGFHAAPSKKPNAVKIVGDHAYHVMLGSGLLPILAAWPRDDGEPANDHVVEAMVCVTELHRCMTRQHITPQVRCMTWSRCEIYRAE